MALNIIDRIEAYTGSTSSDVLSHLTQAAIYDIIKRMIRIDPRTFYEFADSVAFENKTAISATFGVDFIKNVYQNSIKARYVKPELYRQALNTTSIYYATVDSPVWTLLDGYVQCAPTVSGTNSSAHMITTAANTVTTGETIANFPDYLLDAFAIKVASLVFAQRVSANILSIKALTLPTASSITWPTDEASGAIGIQIKPAFISGYSLTVAADLSSFITAASNFISSDWDESLAAAKQNEIAVRIQDFLAQIEAALKEWNAKMAEYQASDSRYTLALQKYQAEINKAATQWGLDIQKFSADLQRLAGVMQANISQYQLCTAQYENIFKAYGAVNDIS